MTPFLNGPFEDLARICVAGRHHQRILQDFLKVDRLPIGEVMIYWHGSYKMVPQKRVEGKILRFRMRANSEISIGSINELLDLIGKYIANLHVHRREFLGQSPNDVGYDAGHHGRNAGDNHTAAMNRRQISKILAGHLQLLECPARPRCKRIALCCQRHATSRPIYQGNTEVSFQIADVRTDRRLRQVKPLGCATKASGFRETDQRLDMAHWQKGHLS